MDGARRSVDEGGLSSFGLRTAIRLSSFLIGKNAIHVAEFFIRTGTFPRTLLPLRHAPRLFARMRGTRRPGTLARGGFPLGVARDLRPLAAGSARRNFRLRGDTPLPHPGDESGVSPPPRGTPRLAPGPRFRKCSQRRSKPKEWGRSEVKRRRAGASHAEPRTEPPSEAAERDQRAGVPPP